MYEKAESIKETSLAQRFFESELKNRDWEEIYRFIAEIREIATKVKDDYVEDEKGFLSRKAEELNKIDSLKF